MSDKTATQAVTLQLAQHDSGAAETERVALWLAEVEAVLQDRLQQSNVATEMHRAHLNLGSFGTACLSLEEGPNDDDLNEALEQRKRRSAGRDGDEN